MHIQGRKKNGHQEAGLVKPCGQERWRITQWKHGYCCINMCLRGGLGWWFGSLGIDDFVNLEPI